MANEVFQLVQATAGHTKLNRIELATSVINADLQTVSGAVSPHTDGNLYAASGNQLLIISQPGRLQIVDC